MRRAELIFAVLCVLSNALWDEHNKDAVATIPSPTPRHEHINDQDLRRSDSSTDRHMRGSTLLRRDRHSHQNDARAEAGKGIDEQADKEMWPHPDVPANEPNEELDDFDGQTEECRKCLENGTRDIDIEEHKVADLLKSCGCHDWSEDSHDHVAKPIASPSGVAPGPILERRDSFVAPVTAADSNTTSASPIQKDDWELHYACDDCLEQTNWLRHEGWPAAGVWELCQCPQPWPSAEQWNSLLRLVLQRLNNTQEADKPKTDAQDKIFVQETLMMLDLMAETITQMNGTEADVQAFLSGKSGVPVPPAMNQTHV